MKILAAAGDNHACTGYRIKDPLNKLQKLKLADVKLIETPGQDFTQNLDKTDVFMFGRAASNEILTQIQKMQKKRKKVVFDLDDSIFDISPYSQHYSRLGIMSMEMANEAGESAIMWEDGKANFDIESNRKFRHYFIKVLQAVDCVTVTTEPLQELYSRFNKRVYAIPNSVDMSVWKTEKLRCSDKPLKILYTGAANHYPDVVFIMPVLEEIQKKYKDVRIGFIGNNWKTVKSKLDYKRVDVYPWVSYEAYPYLLKSTHSDIGIAPIQKEFFDDCRSAIKWYEYSAINAATVATDYGPYKREIENGKTGLLVNDKKEWLDALSSLIENDDLRNELSSNALKRVKSNHNLDYTADKWVEAFQNTLEDK